MSSAQSATMAETYHAATAAGPGRWMVMGTEELLAEQVAYYRARASEYDDWWERRRGYDLGEQVTSAWQADAALLRDALDSFAPRGQVLELAAGTGIWAPPRRFDVVCFTFWLSHVPTARWARFGALVDQALAPGGRVWFCDNAHPEHAAGHGPPAVRDRGDRPELADERRERRLQDGRAFQIVKRYWHPLELERELAAIGWHADVRTTPWAFIFGSATRAEDHARSPNQSALQ
jgi:hypothetical protein